MAKVTKARELVVTVPNRIGSLAKLLRALADAGVNVVALCGEGKGRQGKIRFVVSDPAKAGRALAKAGIAAEKNDVLLAQLSDKPGTGAQLAENLAAAGVNIKAGYASAIGGKALLVLSVNNMPAASRAIKSL